MKLKIFLSICLVCSLGLLTAQPLSKPAKGTFALTNASIHTITNGEVKGNLIIENGKITGIGGSASVPRGATVIDCNGLNIYPGLIDGGTTLGLSEVGSVPLTQDFSESGDLKPQMQALTAVNPNATAIPVTRVDGVTTALVMPTGGTIPGTASLINLVGYTPDQMYAGFKGITLNFPTSVRRRRDNRSDEDREKAKQQALKKIDELMDNARAHMKMADAANNDMNMKPEYNPVLDAMMPVLKGEAPFLIEVNRASDIEAALEWIEKQKVKAVLTGVAEGWRVADKIAAANVPVVAGPVITMPTRGSDRYDKAYANPGLMQKAGVKVAIRTRQSANVRNLPFHAGFAAAYGMGKEEALKAITIVPAEIFGVEDQLGSLEVGKSATLFITDGDPLETRTNIKHIFIDGWQVPKDSRHIRLYDEFLDRQPGLNKN